MKNLCSSLLSGVCLGIATLSAIFTGAASSETVNVSSLADLGAPSETRNTSGQFPTYQNRTVGGVAQVNTKDATFAVLVDFNAGDSAVNGVIWETGGATIGVSVSYNQAAATLSLHHSSNGGNALGVVTHNLTEAQISGGDVEVVWAYDASEIEWELFVDGVSSGTTVDTTAVNSQNSWSGGNAAGLGIYGGNFAAGNGDNTNLAAIANLGDTATINLDTGLRFWAGTDTALSKPTEKAELQIETVTVAEDGMTITWNGQDGEVYQVWRSSDLETWVELDDSITAGPEGGSFLVEGEGLIAGRMFLQVRQFE
jgi:hypothetical protein